MRLERSILKKRYADFCEAWKNEKLRQRYMLEDGNDIPKEQLLGKKPTFAMWLRAVKNKQISETVEPRQAVPDAKVEVTDTDW